MTLDVRDLELLDALAIRPNLTHAAQRLFVSQPALSQRLARIEDSIGGPLFERQGRRLVPNTVGERLLPRAVWVLAELRSIEQEAQEAVRHGTDHLRFATQCSTTYAWLTPVMRHFRTAYPQAQLAIASVPDDDLVAALVGAEIDVAIVTKLDRQADRLTLRHLFDDEMLAVVPTDHPWATRTHVTARDFADAHVVLYDSYDPARVPSTPLPLPPGATPRRLTTVPMVTDLVVELVAGGEGVSVLPSWVVRSYVDRGLVATTRLSRQGAGRSWWAAHRADDDRTAVAGLVDLLVESLGEGPR